MLPRLTATTLALLRTAATAAAVAIATAPSVVPVALASTAPATAETYKGTSSTTDVTGALPPVRAPIERPAAPSGPVPMVRRSVTVTSDIVRLGDLIDNAGAFGSIPVFRSPDVGTTGSVPSRKVIEAARANNLFGVETGDVLA